MKLWSGEYQMLKCIYEELRKKPNLDSEIVCVTNDGWLTVIKAVANFNTSTNPVTTTIFDFNNNPLVWYTITDCTESTGYDIEKGWDFCLNWQLITRFDIINSSTQLVEWSYWVDALWVPQATPDPLLLWARPCTSEECTPLLSVWTIASRWAIL